MHAGLPIYPFVILEMLQPSFFGNFQFIGPFLSFQEAQETAFAVLTLTALPVPWNWQPPALQHRWTTARIDLLAKGPHKFACLKRPFVLYLILPGLKNRYLHAQSSSLKVLKQILVLVQTVTFHPKNHCETRIAKGSLGSKPNPWRRLRTSVILDNRLVVPSPSVYTVLEILSLSAFV